MDEAAIKECYEFLEQMHPDAKPELRFSNEFELLVAVILSAQCTDKRVNMVTEKLFERFKTPYDFAALSLDELTEIVRPCGLGAQKAKGIIESSKILVEKYGGKVPRTIDELMTLPSVGRKTANVVASVAFAVPAIAVDTHVFRVANRIGLCHENSVEKTEKALQNAFPPKVWTRLHHLLIFQGRYVCKAKSPLCRECRLSGLCEYRKTKTED